METQPNQTAPGDTASQETAGPLCAL